MRNLSFNSLMALFCFAIGVGISCGPLFGLKYDLLQSVCLLLGFIGFGVFNILSHMEEREQLIVQNADPMVPAETQRKP